MDGFSVGESCFPGYAIASGRTGLPYTAGGSLNLHGSLPAGRHRQEVLNSKDSTASQKAKVLFQCSGWKGAG